MPAPPTPTPSSPKVRRAKNFAARLMGGESMRPLPPQKPSLRRVQQIVREQLDRRNADPAEDFGLLQIARLERALDLIGAQIDAGKLRRRTPTFAFSTI